MTNPNDTTTSPDNDKAESPTENSSSDKTATTNITEDTINEIPQNKPSENVDSLEQAEKLVDEKLADEKLADEKSAELPEDKSIDKNEEKSADKNVEKSTDKKEENPKDKPQQSEIKVKLPGKYEIIKVEIKHGPLRKAVSKMPLPLAILCCVLNVILPGSGTLVSAFSVFCCGKTEHENILHGFGYNLLATFLQCISAILLIGWIWSIMWGVLFVNLALKDGKKEKEPLPTQV